MSAGSLVQSHTQIPSSSTEEIRRSVLNLRNSNRGSAIMAQARGVQGLPSDLSGLTIGGSDSHDGNSTPQNPRAARMQLLSGLRTAPKKERPADQTSATALTHSDSPAPSNGGGHTSLSSSNRHIPKPLIFLNSPPDGDGVNYSRRSSKHSRGASSSTMHLPKSPSPLSTYYIAETPETLPEFDPDLYALLQQQHQELLATNIYLAQQQQQRLQEQIRLQQLALSGARSPIYQNDYTVPNGAVFNSTLYPQYRQTSPPFDAGKSNMKSPSVVGGMSYQNGPPPYNPNETIATTAVINRPASAGLSPPSPAMSPAFNSSAKSNAGKSWRARGHRKTASSISFNGAGSVREGSPIRQPIGPPPMDELLAADAISGVSPNFASRLRRKAVHQLVQAGVERRKGGEGGLSPLTQYGHMLSGIQASNAIEDDKISKRKSALF